MTEEQIRAASGRKLDALVDRELFGFTHRWMQGRFGREEVRTTMDDDHRFDIPYFSSSMSTCFSEVIPAMRTKGWRYFSNDLSAQSAMGFRKLEGGNGDLLDRRLMVDFGEEATGICRAALLALLAEEGK